MRYSAFQLDYRLALLTAVLLPGLLALGIWQLQRADEKRTLEAAYRTQQQRPPLDYAGLRNLEENLAYRRVKLRGRFLDEPTIFLDNRLSKGRFGYQVVSGFKPETGAQIVLVNRGWVVGDPGRRALPDLPLPRGVLEITGHVYVPTGRPFQLASPEPPTEWPAVMQVLDPYEVAVAAGEAVYPLEIRLDEGSRAALAIAWPLVNMSPDKHQGYAVQWFAMAMALVGILVWRGFMGSDGEHDTDSA